MSPESQQFIRKFEKGGELVYPAYHADVFQTEKGTYYLKEPGVVMIAQSVPHLEGLSPFFDGFDKELGFTDYLNDPVSVEPAAQLVKIAGQACYMSFGPKRTKNEEADKYIARLVESGHGSVLEHPNFTFLFYGVDRMFTHELIRHRAGMGYSQESQRYVGGNVLRFVERPEFQSDSELHNAFEERIDRVASEYEDVSVKLLHLQEEGLDIVSGEFKTDKRKKVRQASRAVLTNETEAIIVATGNARAWRHIINMRASDHAEIQIRRPIFKAYLCLKEAEPISFSDFEIVDLPDGTQSVRTAYPKV